MIIAGHIRVSIYLKEYIIIVEPWSRYRRYSAAPQWFEDGQP
jgi:hypothetical protein